MGSFSSWVGFLAVGLAALMVANALWVTRASKKMRGKTLSDLVGLFPALQDHRGRAAIYCYSDHCGPCRGMTPAIDRLRDAHSGLFKLDVAAHAHEARRLGIRATPTTLLVEDGKVLKVILGPNALGQLKIFLNDD